MQLAASRLVEFQAALGLLLAFQPTLEASEERAKVRPLGIVRGSGKQISPIHAVQSRKQ